VLNALATRERLITLNVVGIIAGLIIIISVLLPWVGVVYSSGLNVVRREFSVIDFFNGQLAGFLGQLLALPPPPQIAAAVNALIGRLPIYTSVAVVSIVLLLIAAVSTFFHGFIGGGIGIIGMLIFSVFAGDVYTRFNTIMPGTASFETTITAGFILAWIAVVLGVISQLFRLKAPQLVSITVWRGRLYYGIPQATPGTQSYVGPTMLRCPNCGLENSPGARFCRNCRTKLI